MKRYKLTLTAQSPVAVGEWMTTRSNVRESMDYIPGGVLRGALAQLTLETLGAHNTSQRKLGNGSTALQQAFDAVFGKDGAQFGFLTAFGEGWIPAPATALFNKQRDEYLYDTLFALIRGEKYEMQCPKTRERLERGRGYLVPTPTGWRRAKMPPKTTYVRVGLNRATEAAEASVLYAIEAVDAPIVFTGEVVLPTAACEQAFQQVLDALRWRDGRILLRIGSARSRGFGEVELGYEEVQPAPNAIPLDDFAARAGRPLFTLLTRTPAIVYDGGSPAATLTPDILRLYLPDLPDSVQLHEGATRVERELVSGWSGAWGMPKPVQQAIAPGSVFTYTYDASERNAVEQCLQQLAVQGIGERTHEGYGQLVACSNYHLEQEITHLNTHTGR
ncbi:MAG: type III-B CRISPR module-associated Cmr3 family protein [bacterium]|nr:type III-B CRISPR module-associated Cmr3 family protein [bacterium]